MKGLTAISIGYLCFGLAFTSVVMVADEQKVEKALIPTNYLQTTLVWPSYIGAIVYIENQRRQIAAPKIVSSPPPAASPQASRWEKCFGMPNAEFDRCIRQP